MSKTVKGEFWVKFKGKKFGSYWRMGEIKSSKNKPNCSPNEVAVKISVEIPESYFEKPALQIALELPPQATDLEKQKAIVQSVSNEIQNKLGINLTVNV